MEFKFTIVMIKGDSTVNPRTIHSSSMEHIPENWKYRKIIDQYDIFKHIYVYIYYNKISMIVTFANMRRSYSPFIKQSWTPTMNRRYLSSITTSCDNRLSSWSSSAFLFADIKYKRYAPTRRCLFSDCGTNSPACPLCI